jgi:2-(1,2-epoxy-1,2-dihydrophenyl)acetyl-CoA isomerase
MAGVKRARDGNVGLLTLSEPSSLNAMTPELLDGLAAQEGRKAFVEKRKARFTER